MLDLSHKQLTVWKKGLTLVKLIYKFTSSFPSEEKFGLTSQLRRASVSVVSNISEGAARKSNKEKRRFYEIARSSLVEIDAQLEIAIALNYVDKEHLAQVSGLLNEMFAMLSSLCSRS
ncbi:four helix bundle protein [Aliifodinibius sp. S!AR15-10]|uniref:four helix bundle protein n=1 Tax=Aliifodinibius sp. S!AR15-10 TaxID=2950437 RepID=UPI0028643BCE|nr:four helix bundle protein [Aliifodinibius sp. S!AR15-10]MDR8394493.1 four helix bundle protein [Aliifodinibius sp. S!AR15-10]